MEKVFIGVDLGTSSVKVGAFTADGREVALTSQGYPMRATEPGMSELDPNEIVSAAIAMLEACVIKLRGRFRVAAVGFSTQQSSLMVVDRDISPLTNLFTWADARAESQTEKILRTVDYEAIFQRTAGRIEHPLYWSAKLTWLHEVRKDLFAPGNKFISIKSYLLYRLTGGLYMDWPDASATGIFNIRAFRFDDMAVAAIPGLQMEHLPETRDCFDAVNLTAEMADRLGLSADTPLVFGAGDGMCAHVGCGALEPGVLSSSVGTSGALRAYSRVPVLDGLRRTFCYCLSRDAYIAGGAINNGGLAVSWLREQFRDQWTADEQNGGYHDFYDMIAHTSEKVPPGSDGLLFMPLLTGERAPIWNGKATGLMSGLQLHHGRGHIVRAALEGVMFQMNAVFGAMKSVTGPAKAIHANSGYTYSDFWLQIQADIFGAPVAVSGIKQASAFGAALIAMVSTGEIPSLETKLPVMRPERIISPNEKAHAAYRECAARYADLYEKHYGLPLK